MTDELTQKLKELGFVQKSDLGEIKSEAQNAGISIKDITDHIDRPCQDGDTPCVIHAKIDRIREEALEKGIIYGSELEKRKH